MPKVVDHEERRAELAAAVWRLAVARRPRGRHGSAGGGGGGLVDGRSRALLLRQGGAAPVRVPDGGGSGRPPAHGGHGADQRDRSSSRGRSSWRVFLSTANGEAEVRVWFAFLGLALTRPALARAQRLTYRAWRDRVAERCARPGARGDPRRHRLRCGSGRARRARGRPGHPGHVRAARAERPPAGRARGRAPRRPARVVASSPMSTGSEQGIAVEPLRFEDGALLILDQRALPEAERWIRCETRRAGGGCIRTLAVRGAPRSGWPPRTAWRSRTARGRRCRELLRSTRPTAVNLAWALEQCRGAPRRAGGGPPAPPRAGRGRPPARRARARSCFEQRRPRPHALQHRRPRHRRLRHRRRRAARGVGARAAGAGLGGRDPSAAPGRPADRLGAAPGRHPAPAGGRLGSAAR